MPSFSSPRKSIKSVKSIDPSERSVTDLGTINVSQHEANQRLEAAEKRRRDVVLALPDPKPGFSGWSTAGFRQSTIPGCPPGMEPVVQNEYVFVMPVANVEFQLVFNMDLVHKYELVDINGKRLYFAVETREEWNDFPSKVRPIEMTLLGHRGGCVCQISGSETQGFTVKNDFQELGSFKRKDGKIHVNDATGAELLKITPVKANGVTEFNVIDSPTTAFVGKIKPSWISKMDEEEGPHIVMPDMFGIQYDKQMVPTSKALLVCLMLTLYFKHATPLYYGNNKTSFFIGVAYNAAIGALILAMVLIVVVFTTVLRKHTPTA